MDILVPIACVLFWVLGAACATILLSRKLSGKPTAKGGENSETCCHCGNPYTPLNDPDYIPELNLCRNCLWKLYYENMFGDSPRDNRTL